MAGLLRNKKGQSFRDVVLLMVFIFFLGVGGLAAVYISDSVYTEFKSIGTLNDTAEKIAVYEASEEMEFYWDFLVVVVLLGFAIAFIAIGYFIDVQSVFFPVYIIATLAGIAFVVVLSYAWGEVTSAGPAAWVAISATHFPITNHIFDNLLIYYVVIAGIGMVASYAKSRGGQ